MRYQSIVLYTFLAWFWVYTSSMLGQWVQTIPNNYRARNLYYNKQNRCLLNNDHIFLLFSVAHVYSHLNLHASVYIWIFKYEYTSQSSLPFNWNLRWFLNWTTSGNIIYYSYYNTISNVEIYSEKNRTIVHTKHDVDVCVLYDVLLYCVRNMFTVSWIY